MRLDSILYYVFSIIQLLVIVFHLYLNQKFEVIVKKSYPLELIQATILKLQ